MMTLNDPGDFYDRFREARDSGDSEAAGEHGRGFIDIVNAIEIADASLRQQGLLDGLDDEDSDEVSLEWLREKRDEVKVLLERGSQDHGQAGG
ncbi:MAG TPA: hypothetical protein VFD58_27465 [Blastocatellia bacterium]|nr:hypothetical protein [Blastocatellia bacterium]